MADLISREEAINAVTTWGTNEERNGNLNMFMVSIKQRVVDILSALPSADRPTMIPIELEKRYPNSKVEDITDAFMRGYQHGKTECDRPSDECDHCVYKWGMKGGTPNEL